VSLTDLLAVPAAARRALDAGDAGVVELTEAALARAEALHPVLGAFATLTPELAREQARTAEAELRAGEARGPLHGLPVAIKDVIDVAGVPTRLGTPGTGHRVPERSAPVVDVLIAGGAIVIGKATTHELALGMTTPAARNPRDPERIAGGSSGGPAVAVAAGIAALALGTDTNGSVRCPASHCGVIGLKPTREALSRAGVAPLAWTQDTVGVLAPDAQSAAVAWSVLDPALDAPSAADAWRVLGPPSQRGEVRRIGVDRAACAAAAPQVGDRVTAALDELAGVELVDVEGVDLALCSGASVLAIVVEAAEAWGSALDGVGPAVRGALRAGREVPPDAYLDAKRARVLVSARMCALFEREALDALALPTVPVTATPAVLDRIPLHGRERSVESLQGLFTAPASLTGQPALSVACGRDADGMPIGLQLLGRSGAEAALLALAGSIGITSNN
jgi:aspartyl-tRNA(Asn)/glutamyl-tRNA(Gln) amidotransferase subunit A